MRLYNNKQNNNLFLFINFLKQFYYEKNNYK